MNTINDDIRATLDEIRDQGLWKDERIIVSPQSNHIRVQDGDEVINFCANNYLGLADDDDLIAAAKQAFDDHGFGMASVRFICGTQDLHKELEASISRFLGFEDTILYTSCWDANGGIFETILGPEDAVFSDALNHASIIDGIRLCKAERNRYDHMDMQDLEDKLEASEGRRKLIVTDGVFSMDGDVAPLGEICDIAEQHEALVMVDDSHATGFFGRTGRGSIEHCDVMDRVDIVTSTLGKALGGASGGFLSAGREIVALLRQRSRPYLFSNTIAPCIAAAGIRCLERLSETTELRDRLAANTERFRREMTDAGFDIRPGEHPIVPIMLGDARLAMEMADDLLERGIYVIGFSYPVVPKGEARIRVQLSAAHTDDDLTRAIEAFTEVGRARDVLS